MIDNSISILGQVISIILGMFSTYIVLNFMHNFKRNVFYKKYVYIIVYIVFTLLIFLSSMYFTGAMRMLTNVLLTIIVGHLFFNREKVYIFYYALFISVMCSLQVILSVSFQYMTYLLNIHFYSLEVYSNTLSLIVQFANLSAVRLFLICFKNKKITRFSKVQYINFLILPLFSIFYIVSLSIYIQLYMSISDIILYIVNVVVIILFNIFITNVFESISNNNELKNQLSLYEKQSRIEYDYYKRLENKYADSSKVIHDIKNHLQIIEELYKDAQEHKAEKYTDDMYRMLDNLSQRRYSTNKVLNIILNDKIEKAEKEDIKVKSVIGDVSLDFIRDIDLTAIISNIFDNAIESARECSIEREIILKIDKFNDFIVINLVNSLERLPEERSGKFKSTKKDHLGLGLENVRLAVERYEGNLKIDYDTKVFKVNIVIPINIEGSCYER